MDLLIKITKAKLGWTPCMVNPVPKKKASNATKHMFIDNKVITYFILLIRTLFLANKLHMNKECDLSKEVISNMKSKWPKLTSNTLQNDEQKIATSKIEDNNDISSANIKSESSIKSIKCPRMNCDFITNSRRTKLKILYFAIILPFPTKNNLKGI